MRTCLATAAPFIRRMAMRISTVVALLTMSAAVTFAQAAPEVGGEASLKLPDLAQKTFIFGLDGHKLLLIGILFCLFGLAFGMAIFMRLKNLPVHRSMREISELIYETCKTYLVTQGKFILLLWAFIAVIIAAVFWLAGAGARKVRGAYAAHHPGVQPGRHRGQLWGGVVRHSRQHIRQLADGVRRIARQAVSGLPDSAQGRHEHRHDADLGRTAHHAVHSVVHPGRLCGPLLHRLRHR